MLEALARWCNLRLPLQIPLRACIMSCVTAVCAAMTPEELLSPTLRQDYPFAVQADRAGAGFAGQMVLSSIIDPVSDSVSLPPLGLLAAVALRASLKLWSRTTSLMGRNQDVQLISKLVSAALASHEPWVAVLFPLRQLRACLQQHQVRHAASMGQRRRSWSWSSCRLRDFFSCFSVDNRLLHRRPVSSCGLPQVKSWKNICR